MKTSYFQRYTGKHAVSIAVITPVWYKCDTDSGKPREYKKLAPPGWLLNAFKDKNGSHYKDEAYYTEMYTKYVLSKLDPQQVYDELGENAVMLCWEKAGDFCHRRLVAKWLKEKLGIEVSEYEKSKNKD